MFHTINTYMLRSLMITLIVVAVILAVIIFLTQSIRYLELVLAAGAAGGTFWLLTLLALPRFLEIILPIALSVSVIFIYFRMMSDQELTILRASGFSPLKIARPALFLGGGLVCLLWAMTLWLTPESMRKVEFMQHNLKAEFSNVLFQEGVFNRFGSDITVFIRDRGEGGELRGLMIHDKRERNPNPVTITARSGQITVNEEGKIQITVYEGTRQDYNPDSQVLNRLDFERFRVDLPSSVPAGSRWRDANERTTLELLDPDLENERDVAALSEFRVELHRRIISPVLAITFLCVALPLLLLGPQGRQGLTRRASAAALSVLILQATYIGAFNIARSDEVLGLIAMYLIIFVPIITGLFLMSPAGENVRFNLFFRLRTSGKGKEVIS